MYNVYSSAGNGGAFYLTTPFLKLLTFEGANINTTYCSSTSNSGGLIYYVASLISSEKSTTIVFTGTTVTNITAKDGRFIY